MADNPSDVLETKTEGRWLKLYLLYVKQDWQSLFSQDRIEKMGHIWHLRIGDEVHSGDYYAYEWKNGLLMCFTASTKEDYEKTLQRFVSERRGISEAWIPPSIFDQLKVFMAQKGAVMYRFISRRSRFSEVVARVGRQEHNRRISYSGDDAALVLSETQIMYGTLPSSMDFRISGDMIQLNRNGLFVIRDINADTLSFLSDMLAIVSESLVSVRQTTEKFQTSTREIGQSQHRIIVPTLVAGKITTPKAKFDIQKVKMFFGEVPNIVEMAKTEEEEYDFGFSFIDTYISEDAASFSATVVDDFKGTVFGMSAHNGEMVLIPKYRTTFESFVKFYETVVEDFDDSASLSTFSEPVAG